jgi:hypothetical protein
MPSFLVQNAPDGRLEVCSHIGAATGTEFRPGSLVPLGAWSSVLSEEHKGAWNRYNAGVGLHANIALVRIFDPAELQQLSDDPHLQLQAKIDQLASPASRRMASERMEEVCRKLSNGSPLEQMGFWLAKGGGPSLSTTRDRSDGCLVGLHLDRWDRRPVSTLSEARNRVCLNLGPQPRYLVFVPEDVRDMARRCQIAETTPFSTPDAQTYLRDHSEIRAYRIRVNPGEAYIAPTEELIHDGIASSSLGEWMYTILGRFENVEEARRLSVV